MVTFALEKIDNESLMEYRSLLTPPLFKSKKLYFHLHLFILERNENERINFRDIKLYREKNIAAHEKSL